MSEINLKFRDRLFAKIDRNGYLGGSLSDKSERTIVVYFVAKIQNGYVVTWDSNKLIRDRDYRIFKQHLFPFNDTEFVQQIPESEKENLFGRGFAYLNESYFTTVNPKPKCSLCRK